MPKFDPEADEVWAELGGGNITDTRYLTAEVRAYNGKNPKVCATIQVYRTREAVWKIQKSMRFSKKELDLFLTSIIEGPYKLKDAVDQLVDGDGDTE